MKLTLRNTSNGRTASIELSDENDLLEQIAIVTGDLMRAHGILAAARKAGKVVEKIMSPRFTIFELTLEMQP